MAPFLTVTWHYAFIAMIVFGGLTYRRGSALVTLARQSMTAARTAVTNLVVPESRQQLSGWQVFWQVVSGGLETLKNGRQLTKKAYWIIAFGLLTVMSAVVLFFSFIWSQFQS